MSGRFGRWVCVLAWLAGMLGGMAGAQGVIEPPFGLRWGDSPEKLVSWASRHKLDIDIHLPGDQPGLRIVKIGQKKGFLPESKAGAVEGRFLGGRLYELGIHYTDAEASAEIMEARFEELKKQLAVEHGALRANQQQRTVADQFVTRTQSFHREPVKGMFLLLAFTEVEDLLRKSREARFTLIYRNDNLKKELQEKLGGK